MPTASGTQLIQCRFLHLEALGRNRKKLEMTSEGIRGGVGSGRGATLIPPGCRDASPRPHILPPLPRQLHRIVSP